MPGRQDIHTKIFPAKNKITIESVSVVAEGKLYIMFFFNRGQSVIMQP